MNVKIFSTPGAASKMEAAINKWLSDSKHVDVKFIEQNLAYDSDEKELNTLISIWYEG